MNVENQIIQSDIEHFHESYQSLILATETLDSMPYSSYAPFVKHNNSYYILMSKIAQHYVNLVHKPYASVLMIEDESRAKNIFFRRRLSYLVQVDLDIDNLDVQKHFIDVFGDMASMLLKMDFIIVKCTILSGNIIVGPGKAYYINENQQVVRQLKGNGGHGHR